MKTYIMCTISVGKIATEILCEKLNIEGIITLNNSVGIKKTKEYYDYSEVCRKYGIKYVDMETYDISADSDIEKINKLEIDLLIVVGWQRLIPKWLIQKCRCGVIGTHGSSEGITLGRGRSPQNWALLLGKRTFFISIFWIDDGVDSGKVIATEQFSLMETDDISISYTKVGMFVAKMILENLDNGRISAKEGTNQESDAFYLPQRKREDGKIDWNRKSNEIYNMVRALTKPYPGAFTCYEGEEYIIWRALPINVCHGYEEKKNGEVVCILDEIILVKCLDGLIAIQECSSREKIVCGMVFESVNFKHQMQQIIDRHTLMYNTPLASEIMEEAK